MVKFRARKVFRFGPYFRRYSASAGRGGTRGGFTSHGIKIGRLTYNFTTRRWSFDTPGPGSFSGGGRRR